MKKYIIAVIVLVIAGAVYWFVPSTPVENKISEEFPEQFSSENLARDARRGAFEGEDTHYAYGSVILIQNDFEYLLRFERDFEVDAGGDLVIGFGKDGVYDPKTEMAPLKGTKGSQNYIFPRETDLSVYNEVWIWSKKASSGYAKAEILRVSR